jgi:hypothetical protein
VSDVKPIKSSRLTLSFVQAFFWFNVLVLPIFDNMSGILFKLNILGDGSIGSPSQLGRLIATIFLIYLIFKIGLYNTKIYSFVILVYFILIECFSALVHWELIPFLYGLVTSSKIIYASLCLLFFVDIVRQGKLNISSLERWLIIYGTVISILVLCAYISGFHISNYSRGIATRGLFISGNGLGIVIGTCFLVLVHQTSRLKIKRILHIFLLLITTALIGTKGSLVFFILGTVYFTYKIFCRYPVFSILILFISSYSLLPMAMEVFGTVFENIIFKFNNIDDKWILLASSRDEFIFDAFNQVIWIDWYSLRFLFGAGAYFGYLDPVASVIYMRKLLENDLFELFFSYGFIASLAYCLLFLYGFLSAFKQKRYFYLSLWTLVFLHSIIAGHIVFNGTSSILLAYIFSAICCKEIKKINLN